MIDSKKISVSELGELVEGQVHGDAQTLIERIANLEDAQEHEIAYVDNEKFFEAARTSKASCLIVPKGSGTGFTTRAIIESSNPKLAFSIIGAALNPPKHREPTIHASASIG